MTKKHTFIPFEKEKSEKTYKEAQNWRKGQFQKKDHKVEDWPKPITYDGKKILSHVQTGDKIYAYAHGLQAACEITNTRMNQKGRERITPETFVDRLIESGLSTDKTPFQLNLFMCQSGKTYDTYGSKADPSLKGKVIAGEVTKALKEKGFRNVKIVGYTEPLKAAITRIYDEDKKDYIFRSGYVEMDTKGDLTSKEGRAKNVQRIFNIDLKGNISDSMPDGSIYHQPKVARPVSDPPTISKSLYERALREVTRSPELD
ncbi:hypothetical protein KFE69_05165 [bacterium SCSIO 12844]|nr:hypothetical protein KFE69_05165 [bacterium SCSIO 12844]